MSVALIITLWIPYLIESKRVEDLNETFYNDLRDVYNDEYKNDNPMVFNPGYTDLDSLNISYDTDNDTMPDSLDLDPLKYDSTIVVVDEKRYTFKSVTEYIGGIAESFTKIATLIITLINIPVAYSHYREKKKNECK